MDIWWSPHLWADSPYEIAPSVLIGFENGDPSWGSILDMNIERRGKLRLFPLIFFGSDYGETDIVVFKSRRGD